MGENPSFHYDLPGCKSGCIHRLDDTQKIRDCGFNSYGPYPGRLFVNEITPHCARAQDRAVYRKQIFDAAEAAVEHAGDGCNTTLGKVRAEREAFNAEARKWWDGPCPFYEASA